MKTAILYDLVKRGAYDLAAKRFLADSDRELMQKVASSLHVCIADIFIQKLHLAFTVYPHIKAVTFVGGVACNEYIGTQLKHGAMQKASRCIFLRPAIAPIMPQ